MTEPASVLEAVQAMEAEGFGANFVIRGDGCTAASVAKTTSCRRPMVRVYRFEGPSDPDEAAVVTRSAVRSAAGGSLVSTFGPTADPEITDRLVLLDERFGRAG